MGYEVLGSGGVAGAGPAAADTPVEEVVELWSQDEAGSGGPAPSGRLQTRRRWPGRRWVGIAAVAAVAALVSGLVMDHRDATRHRHQESAALHAAATVTGSRTSQGDRGGEGDSGGASVTSLTAELSNYGPVPVTVVVGSTPDGRQVSLPDGVSPVVSGGGHLQVDLQLRDPCRSDLPRPRAALPVRTADGTSHDLALTTSGGDLSFGRTSCGAPTQVVPDVAITAEVTGTMHRPVRRLSNLSQVPVRFELLGGSSFTPAQPFSAVRVSTRPALPISVPAGGVEDVVLDLVAERCERDLGRIRAYSTPRIAGSASGLEPSDVLCPICRCSPALLSPEPAVADRADNVRGDRARSFKAVAGAYDRARAWYPQEAVAWVLEPVRERPGVRVLDLGAGTGRLSAVLLAMAGDALAFGDLARGDLAPGGSAVADLAVVAVEPDDAMRAMLPDGVTALDGTAERVPLPDRSVDAVLVGQAWHWFNEQQALAEVRRVLRPGGVLGLLSNVFDDRVPWVADVAQACAAVDRLSVSNGAQPCAGEPVPVRRQFPNGQAMTRALLVDNIASRSRTVLLAPDDRQELLQRTRDLAPAEAFVLPWVCDTWRARTA